MKSKQTSFPPSFFYLLIQKRISREWNLAQNKTMDENERAVWNGCTRRLVWTIMSAMRRPLNLSISPVIATSFTLLHHHFREHEHSPYMITQLIIASIFLGCKIEDAFCPMNYIYAAYASVCRFILKKADGVASLLAIGIHGPIEDSMKEDAILEISKIEIELLNNIKWNLYIDSPFKYMKQHVIVDSGSEEQQTFSQNVLHNLCLLMRTSRYLDLNPEISAAAGVFLAFRGGICDCSWANSVREREPEAFNECLDIIKMEMTTCIPINS